MNCPKCSAPMILGVTPASPGWCSAECDLGAKTVSAERSFTFWDVPEMDGWAGYGHFTVRTEKELGESSRVLFTLDGGYLALPSGTSGVRIIEVEPTGGVVLRRVFPCVRRVLNSRLYHDMAAPTVIDLPEDECHCYLQGDYKTSPRPNDATVWIEPGSKGVVPREVIL